MADLERLVRQVERLQHRISLASRHGFVTEVKDGKVRVSLGFKPDGTPHPSPWVYPGQHNGIVRQDVPFRKGQSITVEMPTGDPRQARVLPYAPNEENPRPVHASDTAATTQMPHFDKDGKEEKDKDKPGFQRTESSTERTTVMDKISTSTQTKDKQSREILDKVGGKARSFIEQTFGGLQRKLEDGKGAVSELMHTAQEVLHKVGDKASHSHTAEGFLRQVGGSKLQHLADKVLHSVGGHSSEMMAGGTKFLGGLLTHDGKNIGGSHTHKVPGPFGMVMSLIPEAPSGGGGGDGGGGGPGGGDPPDPEEPMNWDMVAFAWGGFTFDGTTMTPYGSFRGVEIETIGERSWHVRFTAGNPHAWNQYRVQLNQEGPLTIRVDAKTPEGFTIIAPEGPPFLAWFLVLP